MKKRLRTFLRIETSERILIRYKTRDAGGSVNSGESIGRSFPDAKYRLEIYKIEAGVSRILFEREFTGPFEFVEP